MEKSMWRKRVSMVDTSVGDSGEYSSVQRGLTDNIGGFFSQTTTFKQTPRHEALFKIGRRST